MNQVSSKIQGQGADALRAAAEGGSAPWMQATRAGLHTLLQAKLDPGLRQAVLCLTARFCHLASPQWLQVNLTLDLFLRKLQS